MFLIYSCYSSIYHPIPFFHDNTRISYKQQKYRTIFKISILAETIHIKPQICTTTLDIHTSTHHYCHDL